MYQQVVIQQEYQLGAQVVSHLGIHRDIQRLNHLGPPPKFLLQARVVSPVDNQAVDRLLFQAMFHQDSRQDSLRSCRHPHQVENRHVFLAVIHLGPPLSSHQQSQRAILLANRPVGPVPCQVVYLLLTPVGYLLLSLREYLLDIRRVYQQSNRVASQAASRLYLRQEHLVEFQVGFRLVNQAEYQPVSQLQSRRRYLRANRVSSPADNLAANLQGNPVLNPLNSRRVCQMDNLLNSPADSPQ